MLPKPNQIQHLADEVVCDVQQHFPVRLVFIEFGRQIATRTVYSLGRSGLFIAMRQLLQLCQIQVDGQLRRKPNIDLQVVQASLQPVAAIDQAAAVVQYILFKLINLEARKLLGAVLGLDLLESAQVAEVGLGGDLDTSVGQQHPVVPAGQINKQLFAEAHEAARCVDHVPLRLCQSFQDDVALKDALRNVQ